MRSGLSLIAIMLDEEANIGSWVAGIASHMERFRDILVIDGGSRDKTVELLEEHGIPVIVRPFPNDFSDQRNFAIDHTKGEWIFELDADEVGSHYLMAALEPIIRQADKDEVDCIGIPRLNFHDGILQPSPGSHGLDYQYRLHRHYVRWHKPVHEEPVGWTARVEIDILTGRFLKHSKTTARHEQRNQMYRTMESK